ncbi:hypothetical protein KC726_01410 [Candidatus Woesebacteria bacterium]|nr:hypothetical protein [Candidatus Woesebacteria bacterium]
MIDAVDWQLSQSQVSPQEKLQNSHDFPFFHPVSESIDGIVNDSPTAVRYVNEHKEDAQRLMQATQMFGRGGEGYESLKVALAMSIPEPGDSQVIQDFSLRNTAQRYREAFGLLSKFQEEPPIVVTPQLLKKIPTEAMLSFALQEIARVSTVDPSKDSEQVRNEAAKLGNLAMILKAMSLVAYENQENSVSVVGNVNDTISALRDIALYMRHPTFFLKTSKMAELFQGIHLHNLYNTEKATSVLTSALADGMSPRQLRVLNRSQIIGGFKSISSQLYEALYDQQQKDTGKGQLTTDIIEKAATSWQDLKIRKEIELKLMSALPNLNDRFRARVFCQSVADYNCLARRLSTITKMGKIWFGNRTWDTSIWSYHMPANEEPRFTKLDLGKNPGSRVLNILEDAMKKRTVCYTAVHSYIPLPVLTNTDRSRMLSEIQLRFKGRGLPIMCRLGAWTSRTKGLEKPIDFSTIIQGYEDIFNVCLDEIEALKK